MELTLTPSQKRAARSHEFYMRYGRYWLIYAALIFTAALSFTSGVVLPFHPDESGRVTLTIGGVALGLYFGLGFVSNGEGAAGFWFGKMTDHDKDNTTQKIIAWFMLFASITVSLITSLAAAAQLAYLLGVLSEFQSMPTWAQEWIVWSIPTMWVGNAVAGMAFRAVSDEAEAEREAAAIIRETQQRVMAEKQRARARYWQERAPAIYAQLGEIEAKNEIARAAARLSEMQTPRLYAYAAEAQTPQPEENPTRGGGKAR